MTDKTKNYIKKLLDCILNKRIIYINFMKNINAIHMHMYMYMYMYEHKYDYEWKKYECTSFM